MPYIKLERRIHMDAPLVGVDALIENAGDLTYVICRLTRSLASKLGDNFDAQNSAWGAVNAASAEYYRRVIGPYEDTKIIENGDVFGTADKTLGTMETYE